MMGFVIGVFAIAGMIKGTIGLGLPAVSMGLLSLVISPFQAATLLIIPSMVTNFWQLFAEGHVWRLVRRFYPLLLGIIIGSIWSIFPTLGHSSGGFHSEALLGECWHCMDSMAYFPNVCQILHRMKNGFPQSLDI